jgi:uncharacterized RDD family membrane protein YckC
MRTRTAPTDQRLAAADAGLGRRIGAHLIDSAIIYGAIGALQFGVLRPLGLAPDPQTVSGARFEGYLLATVSLPAALYLALTEGSGRQATIGKRLLGLRVATVDGGRVGVGRALLRAAVKFLPFEVGHLAFALPVPLWRAPGEFRAGFLVVWLLLGLDLLAILRIERRRSVHDLAAGTVVIRARCGHVAG